MKSIKTPARLLFLSALCATSHAAVVPFYEGSYVSGSFYDGEIATSLITTGQSSLAGVSGQASSLGANGFSLAGVNNGSATNANYATLAFYTEAGSLPATIPAAITFTLSGLYDITSIRSVAGWTDSFFGAQSFQLSMESNNSGIFTSYGTFTASPDPLVNGEDTFSTRITLTDSTGTLATSVSAIRFVFVDPYPSYPSNGTVVRELSVTGNLTVPEPTVIGLVGLVAFPALLRRRRSR